MNALVPITLATPPGALTTVEIDTVRRFAENEKAASSRRAYESDYRIYRAWCASRGLCALPAEPATIAAFLADEATAGRKASTIGRRLAAIRYAHKLTGISEPPTNSELVRATLRGSPSVDRHQHDAKGRRDRRGAERDAEAHPQPHTARHA